MTPGGNAGIPDAGPGTGPDTGTGENTPGTPVGPITAGGTTLAPTELLRYVESGTTYLGSWTPMGPLTLQQLRQQMTGTQKEKDKDCVQGSADAAGNCN